MSVEIQEVQSPEERQQQEEEENPMSPLKSAGNGPTDPTTALRDVIKLCHGRCKDGRLHEDDVAHILGDELSRIDPYSPMLEQKGQLIAVFEACDKDHDGCVDITQFIHGMTILLQGTEHERMRFAFTALDVNHDGNITLDEFLAYFKHYFATKWSIDNKGSKMTSDRWAAIEDHLKRVFKATDTDKDGVMNIEQLIDAVNRDPDHPLTMIWASADALYSATHATQRRPSQMRMSA